MAANRLFAWLLTDAGKKFSYFATGTVASGVLLGHVLPHTLFLDKYKNIFHLYKNGFAVQLSPKLRERFEKALTLAGVEDQDRHLYKPFAAYGFDIISAGTAYSKYGVVVGLPANFAYEDESSVDKRAIKIRDESIIWDLEEGQSLLKALVLSENAQIYAMAREIKYRQTPKTFLDTIISVSSIIGLYGICNTINVKQNLYAKPLTVRLILYCIVGAFSAGSYALCTDVSQVYYEEKIDKELKNKDPALAEGGKEFYTKILERNKALRRLLGREGEKIYTVLGNENYFIRHKHIPLVQRKLFFEESFVE